MTASPSPASVWLCPKDAFAHIIEGVWLDGETEMLCFRIGWDDTGELAGQGSYAWLNPAPGWQIRAAGSSVGTVAVEGEQLTYEDAYILATADLSAKTATFQHKGHARTTPGVLREFG